MAAQDGASVAPAKSRAAGSRPWRRRSIRPCRRSPLRGDDRSSAARRVLVLERLNVSTVRPCRGPQWRLAMWLPCHPQSPLPARVARYFSSALCPRACRAGRWKGLLEEHVIRSVTFMLFSPRPPGSGVRRYFSTATVGLGEARVFTARQLPEVRGQTTTGSTPAQVNAHRSSRIVRPSGQTSVVSATRSQRRRRRRLQLPRSTGIDLLN